MTPEAEPPARTSSSVETILRAENDCFLAVHDEVGKGTHGRGIVWACVSNRELPISHEIESGLDGRAAVGGFDDASNEFAGRGLLDWRRPYVFRTNRKPDRVAVAARTTVAEQTAKQDVGHTDTSLPVGTDID